MSKRLELIFKYIFIFITSFLLGVVIANTINFYNSNYEIVFTTKEEFNYKKLVDKEYLVEIRDGNEKYQSIDIDKMIEKKDVNIYKDGNEYKIVTGYEYYETFFISSSKTKGTRVRKFFIDAIDNLVINDAEVEYKYSSTFIITNNLNIHLIGAISSLLCLCGYTFYLIKINGKEKKVEKINLKENYFKDSLMFLDSTKKIVTLAMLFGLMMICKIFSLPSGFSNLGLSLTYLFFALIGLIYGPIAGFTIGFFSDVLGYFLFDKSGLTFYFGYTLQAMLAGLVYGLFLYKSKITFVKCFIARLIINLFLNVVLGSIFFGDVMNYDFETIRMYALIIELPKNLIYLLPQSILLFIFLKFISPILYRNKYINKYIYENVSII